MPRQRIDLPFPLGGRDDNISFGKQPPLTTTRAVNVRAIDPSTGRVRGGQRSGTTRFRQAGTGSRVQDLVALAYDKPNITYTQLEGSGGNSISTVWEADLGNIEEVLDAAVSPQGDVYVVTSENTVVMQNSAGKVLHTITLPVESADSQVRRIAVDDAGSAYVAAGSGGIFDSAKIHKLELDDSGRLTVAWTVDADGDEVIDLEWQDGILYSIEHVTYEDPRSLVGAYAFLNSDYPSQIWSRDVPHPASKLAASGRGSVYVACQPSLARVDQGNTTFMESQVSWGPYELSESSSRLYAWVAADSEREYRRKGEGFVLPDHRPARNKEDGSGIDITDLRRRWLLGGRGFLEKSLVHTQDGPAGQTISSNRVANVTTRKAPRFDVKGFDRKPGLRFNSDAPLPDESRYPDGLGGRGLFSGPTSRLEFKAEATDKLDHMGTLWPMVNTGVRWFSCMMVRTSDFNTPQVLAWQGDGQGGQALRGGRFIGIGLNATGNIYDQPTTTTSRVRLQVGDGTTVAGRADAYDQTLGVALITIVHNGANSDLRVNGLPSTSGVFNWPSQGRWKTGRFHRTYIGTSARWDEYDVDRDLFHDGWGQFDGWLGEIVTVFGRSTTSPHDTHNAGDVELVEGYLAWKWGVGHLLDTSAPHPYATNGTPGGVPAGTSGSDFDNIYASFRDRRPYVIKVNADYGDAVWAQPFESGAGYSVAATSEGGVITAGPRRSQLATDVVSPLSVAARKFYDSGRTSSAGAPSSGVVYCDPAGTASGVPPPGDWVEIPDGSITVRFTADTVGVPGGLINATGSSTGDGEYRWICVSSPENSARNLEAAIDSARAVEGGAADTWRIFGQRRVLATHNVDDSRVDIFHLDNAVNDNAITVSAAGPLPDITVSGLSGGIQDPSGAWQYHVDQANDLQSTEIRMHVDGEDDVYIPWSPETATERGQLRKLDSADGSLLYAFDIGNNSRACSVAADPFLPLYQSGTVTGPEFVYLTTDNAASPGTSVVRKLRLVGTAPTNDSVRQHRLLAVASGRVYRLDRFTNPTLAAGLVMNSTSIYVASTVAFGNVYWTDGVSYFKYDPLDGANGTVSTWEAATSGQLPKRAKLITTWNGRVVLGRMADDPHNWYASAVGDPEDWNIFPRVPSLSQAIDGRHARTGINRDIINALIPYNDDLLIIGGDHSVQRLTGDPMAGGQIDLVSDQTGIAFGRAWTKDPEGTLYFYGSRGGVYAMAPGGVPVDIARHRIERSLRSTNLTDYSVRLVWNDYDNGLHIYFVRGSLSVPATDPVRHFFWDRKSDSWWEDEFSTSGLEPGAVAVFDGDDPGDRVIALGGEDGVIRYLDPLAASDDSNSANPLRIYSMVRIGPLARDDVPVELMFHNWEFTLSPTQQGASYRIYQSDDPQVLGSQVRSGSLVPGKNPPIMDRARGSAVWLDLYNGRRLERWAYDGGGVWVTPIGTRRVRA